MNREDARRKYTALRRMTVQNGATPDEAATAQSLADRLAARFDFSVAQDTRSPDRPGVAQDWYRAYQTAARTWNWEHRKCGKPTCWCTTAPRGKGHGPYRYAKKRIGRKVVSEYIGG